MVLLVMLVNLAVNALEGTLVLLQQTFQGIQLLLFLPHMMTMHQSLESFVHHLHLQTVSQFEKSEEFGI